MSEKLTINVISDIHYYDKSTGTSGKAYERALSKSQKFLAESGVILEDCFARLAADTQSDIILVSGDVTSEGEKAAHHGVINLLRKLKEAGKKVYVLTATHDYKQDCLARGYKGDDNITVPAYKREELFELYREFGPDEAIAVHKKSMSYIVQLADDYRLFALNDDSNLNGASGFSDECFDWILKQAEDARKNNQFIITMTHHPVVTPSPFYTTISEGDMMGGYKQRREQLSDAGISFIFTGHTHMQDIASVKLDNGKTFYDITTASTIGFPGTYRKLVCDKNSNRIEVSTVDFAKESTLTINGLPLYEAMENQFFGMIRGILDAAANDADKFASMVGAMSIKESTGKKLGIVIKPVAKYFNNLTVGKVAAKADKKRGGNICARMSEAEKNERVVDFIVSLVAHLFGGDAPYTPDTPQYAATMHVLEKIDSILKVLHIDIGKFLKGAKNVRTLVEPLLYNNDLCDREAVIDLD